MESTDAKIYSRSPTVSGPSGPSKGDCFLRIPENLLGFAFSNNEEPLIERVIRVKKKVGLDIDFLHVKY